MLQLIEAIAVIPTAVLLFVVMLQVALILSRKKREFKKGPVPSVSVLIPAHNEGKYLARAIRSILDSGYREKKEIIVIDDGSEDNTQEVLKQFKGRIRAIRTNHIGKSNALNKGLEMARNEIVITIDGDSKIEKGSIQELVAPFCNKRVVATTGAVKVASTRRFLTWFQRVEYLYYSFYKHLCDKVNGIIWTLGTLSAFRRKALVDVGGFNNKLFAEDIDLALKLIKKGKVIRYVPRAVCRTFVPEKLRELMRQRVRWSKGIIQISKNHSGMYFNKKNPGSGFFSLPLLSYWYFHSTIIIILVFLQVFLGYHQYFYMNGTVMSLDVLQYFFYWFTVFGVINLAWQILVGNWPVTLLAVLNILVVGLTYGIYIYSIRWFGERPGFKDLVVFVFMFPYWIVTMAAQLLGTVEWFRGEGRNWWKK